MKQAIGLGIAALALVLGPVGCANDPAPPEQKASTTSHLTGADGNDNSGGGAAAAKANASAAGQATSAIEDCADGIQATVGSADWRAQFQQCVDQAVADEGAGGGDDGSGGDEANGNGNGNVGVGKANGNGATCTSGISCLNGACQCTSGPNQGMSCDGAGDGADGCSALCNFCQ